MNTASKDLREQLFLGFFVGIGVALIFSVAFGAPSWLFLFSITGRSYALQCFAFWGGIFFSVGFFKGLEKAQDIQHKRSKA